MGAGTIVRSAVEFLDQPSGAWPDFVAAHSVDFMDVVSSPRELHLLAVAPERARAALVQWLARGELDIPDVLVEALENAEQIIGDLDVDWPFPVSTA